MNSLLRKENNYSISEWSGGKTKELVIFPRDCRYADRDFIFRLSSATVELDESDFTMLPDYNRVLMVLEGSVVLTYDGKKTVHLNELEQDSFDGASVTKSFGRITDFNLMVRKGCDGMLDVLRPAPEAEEPGNTLFTEHNRRIHALYCREGYCIVNAGGQQKMISPGQLFIMDFGEEEPEYSLMGDGVIIRAQIGHDSESSFEEEAEDITVSEEKEYEEAEKRSVEEASEDETSGNFADTARRYGLLPGHGKYTRPTVELNETSKVDYKGGFAEDFKWSFILANTQFKGARYIFKKLDRLVYDEELSSKIRKLERFFITMLVFLAALMLIMTLAMKAGNVGEGTVFILCLIWLVVDCVLVSPLIYYAALPKPIRSHIHDMDKMSQDEVDSVMEERSYNERLERLLDKYSNSGRNVGTVMADKARREKELDE